MEEESIKEVNIELTYDGITYSGIAKVNLDSDEVDLSQIKGTSGGVHVDINLDKVVYYQGYCIARLREILTCTAVHEADPDSEYVGYCDKSGYYVDRDRLVCTADDKYICEFLAVEWNGDFYDIDDCSEHTLKDRYGDTNSVLAPDSYWEGLCFCDRCGCYLEDSDYYWGDGICTFCHDEEEEESSRIIEDYCESHDHTPIFFGDYKDKFIGLGFELEVDCDSSNQRNNTETAENLCNVCGLQDHEMRYAYDGSLNYGFECISQPHTVKDFWDKQAKWRKMLSYLSEKGYKSHDAKTCGLHVHVTREMFGKNKAEQDSAIAKVYTFFDDNWCEIVKVSRRSSFDYCEKNTLPESVEQDSKFPTKYDKWKKTSKFEGGHHVALNNYNTATFEYRLGRGTLNAWSFFSWIDFVLTITKNAKRITVNKVISNDRISWLGGIRESTAKYMYKRGAFRKEVLALYPNIEWETDLTDSSNN